MYVGDSDNTTYCSKTIHCIGSVQKQYFSKKSSLLSTHLAHRVHACTMSSRLRLKRDGTRAETRFRLSAKRTSPFKSAGASVQSTTGSLSVRISGSNAGYTKFRGSGKSTGYTLHPPVSPSLPLPCVTMCHHISTWLYNQHNKFEKHPSG